MNTTPDVIPGLEVSLHRSLVEPILFAGLPRSVALMLWIAVLALAFGLRQLWVLPIGIVLHLICAGLTRTDPHFFEILIRAAKAQRRLDP